MKRISLFFLVALIFIGSFTYAQYDQYETKIVFVPDESKETITNRMDDEYKRLIDELRKMVEEIDKGEENIKEFYMDADGITVLRQRAEITDSERNAAAVNSGDWLVSLEDGTPLSVMSDAEFTAKYKKMEPYKQTEEEQEHTKANKKKFREKTEELAILYKDMLNMMKKAVKSKMVSDINRITLKGWEIKTSRRTVANASIDSENEIRIWGTEYTLQRKVGSDKKKSRK